MEPSLCKGCMLCVEACPQGVLEESPSRVNSRGYALPEPLRLDKCTGCRLCEMLCPDFAIEVDASG
ncbi:MAG: 4Fe-4S binding protein, partial [Fervidicoccaceae archaeon]